MWFVYLLDQSYHLDQKTGQLELQPKIRYVLQENSGHFFKGGEIFKVKSQGHSKV